jgi:hypothetical protein
MRSGKLEAWSVLQTVGTQTSTSRPQKYLRDKREAPARAKGGLAVTKSADGLPTL